MRQLFPLLLSIGLLAGEVAAQEARPTTIIEISLVSPEGPVVLPLPRVFGRDGKWGSQDGDVLRERRARVRCSYLDTALPQRRVLSCTDLEPIAGTHKALLTVERHRTVGLLGYSFRHGLVERAITPQMMEGKTRLAVELALPAAQPPGILDVDLNFGFKRAGGSSEELVITGPLTGCSVQRMDFNESTSSGCMTVAPGTYVATMWPRNENPFACYEVSAYVPAGVELWREVTVAAGERASLSHDFDVSSGFSCRVDVCGREREVADCAAGLKKSLPGTMASVLYDFDAEIPAPGWYLRAALLPMDLTSSWTRRELNLSWNQSSRLWGAATAPLGATLLTLDRVPPGDYVIELSGPWIEAASFELAIEDEPHWLSKDKPQHRFEVRPKL